MRSLAETIEKVEATLDDDHGWLLRSNNQSNDDNPGYRYFANITNERATSRYPAWGSMPEEALQRALEGYLIHKGVK